jgi:3-hydroxyacyl-[acyl-carrier-protein] dehydratase
MRGQHSLMAAVARCALDEIGRSREGWYSRHYCFTPDFVGFSGHFHGFPILPAFIQIILVKSIVEETKGLTLSIQTIEKAKFQMEITPGLKVEASYRELQKPDRSVIDARLKVAGKTASTIVFTCSESPLS